MPLRHTLRRLAHQMAERVSVILQTVGFLRKKIPEGTPAAEALDELEAASVEAQRIAQRLENVTRVSRPASTNGHTPTNGSPKLADLGDDEKVT